MQGFDFIFSLALLLMSVVVHEVSHGYAAYALGDPTAKYQGRLTLNPLKHLDLFGSILLPLFLLISQVGFLIGWAKPVPYNPYNLRNPRSGEAIVAVAGPLSNIIIAIIFGFFIRFGVAADILSPSFVNIAGLLVFINILLAVFNLVPIPPLDGSKILFSILPFRYRRIRFALEKTGIILILIFIFFLWRFLVPIVAFFFNVITGL